MSIKNGTYEVLSRKQYRPENLPGYQWAEEIMAKGKVIIETDSADNTLQKVTLHDTFFDVKIEGVLLNSWVTWSDRAIKIEIEGHVLYVINPEISEERKQEIRAINLESIITYAAKKNYGRLSF